MKYVSFLWICGLCMSFSLAAQQGIISPGTTFESVAISATAKQVDKQKIRLDTATRRVILPVRPGTTLKHFKPDFATPAGVTVTLSSKDFSKGPIQYQIAINGKGTQAYTIEAKEYHNPL